jgi:nucleoside-diphosphate-sugar epimerase
VHKPDLVVVGGLGDIGSAFMSWCARSDMRIVSLDRSKGKPALPQGPHKHIVYSGLRDLARKVRPFAESGVPLLNFAGMNRASAYNASVARQTLISNFVLPTFLGNHVRQVDGSLVNLSSAELDGPQRASAINGDGRPGGAVGILEFEDIRDVANPSDLLRTVEARLGPAWWRHHEPYRLSKQLMELAASESRSVACVRLTNVVGPDYRRLGLIPRLLRARLTGETIHIENEIRNWVSQDDLAPFLAELASGDGTRGVVPGYGAYDVPTPQVADMIRELLPTCYGELIIDGASPSDRTRPDIPRISHSDAHVDSDFAEILWQTCRVWRTHLRVSIGAMSIPVPAFQSELQRRTFGGSIASKIVSSGTVITKSTHRAGYEGAGRAKLAAEVKFYLSLGESRNSELRALYPRLVDNSISEDSTSMTLELIGDGRTLADTLVSGGRFPTREVSDVVGRLFRASYLRELRTLDPQHSTRTFHALYVGRAMDRLLAFDRLATERAVSGNLRRALDIIMAGDSIVIDGVSCVSPLVILRRWEAKPPDALLPKVVGPCGHGDLTALNMVWEVDGGLRLIDPRGECGYWDPAYDLGKLAFSLSGFAECIKGNVAHVSSLDGFASTRGGDSAPFVAGRRWLDEWISAPGALDDLESAEPRLALRVKFAEATHYLADIAYRYMQGMDEERALSVLLMGCVQLNAAAAQLSEEVDN